METLINDARLKTLIKEAVAEVMEERKDVLRELLIEAIEDIGLVNAIKEGEKSKSISRDEVFKILNNK